MSIWCESTWHDIKFSPSTYVSYAISLAFKPNPLYSISINSILGQSNQRLTLSMLTKPIWFILLSRHLFISFFFVYFFLSLSLYFSMTIDRPTSNANTYYVSLNYIYSIDYFQCIIGNVLFIYWHVFGLWLCKMELIYSNKLNKSL